MPEPDLIELFAQPLSQANIRYLISGSVAAMLYGEPRVTHDIDLIVFLRSEDVPRLNVIFPSPMFYVPPVAAIFEELARERGQFNLLHADSGLKADFFLAGRDELHGWAFRHARRYVIGGNTITIAPPEYVIIRKLEYHREGGLEKHIRDIRAILAVTGEQVDRLALNDWLSRLGLEDQWKKI